MNKLKLACLGRFQASFGEAVLPPFRTSKVQALLIYLAVEATAGGVDNAVGMGHRREALMELLWPDQPLKGAQQNLRQTLYQLRKAIPDQESEAGAPVKFIESSRISIGINPAYALELDAANFDRYLKEGDLEAAVALYRGDFLSDFYLPDSAEFESWAQQQRSSYHRQASAALDSLAVEYLESGRLEQALEFARQQLTLDDLNERAQRQVMEGLARLGRREAALAQYEACRQLLADELGVEPDPETEMLLARIQSGELRVVDESPARVTAVPRGMPRWEREEQLPLFVGRENELALLTAALERTGKGNGRPQFIIGGAGRGKTALVNAFARQALAENPDLLILSGYCRGPATTGEPYLPFRHILAQLTGDVSGSAVLSREQAEKLWAAMPETIPLLVEYGPDLVNALLSGSELRHRAATFSSSQESWFRRLCQLLDQADGEQPRQDRLFSQVTSTLRAVSGERPLLLILEDLHWSDAASAGLLMHLCLELAGSRILLLGTYRPEEVHTADGHPLAQMIGELKRQFGDIWIDLGEEESGRGRHFINAYLDAEANDLDESFRKKLYGHTGGHALFTVELLRAMQERGEIARDEAGRWQVQASLNWDELPAKVEGVIEQRFGRLDADLQEALSVAAVEGETFTAAIVAEIQGMDERRLVRRLSREVERQHRLVEAEALEWSNGRRLARYRFRHQIFQQYLYQELDEIEKTYMHEAVGLKLEELYVDQDLPVAALAWHFDCADNHEKAVPYLIQAGDAARMLYATKEAINYYERALVLLKAQGDYDKVVRVLMTLGLTHMNAFDFEAAQKVYTEGFELRLRTTKHSEKIHLSLSPHTLKLATDIKPLETPIFQPWDNFLLFPRLFQVTADFNILPDLASSWDILNNGHTYLFHLRDDVFWSDGQPVTANDFVFAWRWILNLQRGLLSPETLYDIVGVRDYHQGLNKNKGSLGFEALDNYTLKIDLTQPTAYFLQVLTGMQAAPLPQHFAEDYGEGWSDSEEIVSCGPFLPSHRDKESIVLDRNPAYHDRIPGNVQHIVMRYCPSPLGKLALYEKDSIDVVDIRAVSTWEFQRLIRTHADEYATGPGLGTYSLSFNVNIPPFDDPRVRRAFVLATDREKLSVLSAAGRAFPVTGGFTPPGIPGHISGIALPHDQHLACRLLAEAGYSSGNDLPALDALITPWDVSRLPEYVFQPWQDNLGVSISWQEIPWSDYREQVQRNQPHISVGGWVADYPDPDDFLRIALHRVSDWRDETYDALVEKARVSLDHQVRLDLFRQAEQILIQEAPILPLLNGNNHLLAKPWIKNVQPAMVYWPIWHHIIIEPH